MVPLYITHVIQSIFWGLIFGPGIFWVLTFGSIWSFPSLEILITPLGLSHSRHCSPQYRSWLIKVLTWLIMKNTRNPMNQSEVETITCWWKAWETMCKLITITGLILYKNDFFICLWSPQCCINAKKWSVFNVVWCELISCSILGVSSVST